MRSGHIKVKKGTHHLFYMAIARHTTESVQAKSIINLDQKPGTSSIGTHKVKTSGEIGQVRRMWSTSTEYWLMPE